MGKAATTKASETKEENVPKSFFDEFKLVPAIRKTAHRGDGLSTARNRIIEGVRAQKDAVIKELAGEVIEPTEFTNKKGKTIKRASTKWYYENGGSVFTEVRYGQKSVFMDGTKPQAFEAGKTLKDLPAFYDRLVQAIERGELDTPIGRVQKEVSDALTRPPSEAPRDTAETQSKEAAQ